MAARRHPRRVTKLNLKLLVLAGGTSMKHASRSAPHRMVTRTALGLALLCSVFGAIAHDDGPAQLRQTIGHQTGGLDKLKVPATNAEMPVPRQADGTVSYRYETTEAKRYL